MNVLYAAWGWRKSDALAKVADSYMALSGSMAWDKFRSGHYRRIALHNNWLSPKRCVRLARVYDVTFTSSMLLLLPLR